MRTRSIDKKKRVVNIKKLNFGYFVKGRGIFAKTVSLYSICEVFNMAHQLSLLIRHRHGNQKTPQCAKLNHQLNYTILSANSKLPKNKFGKDHTKGCLFPVIIPTYKLDFMPLQ